jgi:hypothetical protein
MKIKDMTIEQRLKVAARLQQPNVPWDYERAGLQISISVDLVSFGGDGDYISLEEAQGLVRYLMKEFGVY